jgi:hypothetical protein
MARGEARGTAPAPWRRIEFLHMNRRKRQGLGSTEAVRVEPIHGGQDIINGLLDLHPVAAVDASAVLGRQQPLQSLFRDTLVNDELLAPRTVSGRSVLSS